MIPMTLESFCLRLSLLCVYKQFTQVSGLWYFKLSVALTVILSRSCRLKVYTEDGEFLNTECICDNQIKGGKLGVYVFEQEAVIFSDLSYACLTTDQIQDLQQCHS